MKKLLLLLAIVLAFSFTALAQDTGAQGTQSQTTTTTTTKTKKHMKAEAGQAGEKTAAKEHTLTGCLAKAAEGNGYELTNGRYKKGVAVNSSEDLAAHVGHEVELTGTWEKPTSGEAGAGPKGKEMRTFNATAVKHISDTCKMAGGKKGKKGAAATTPGL